MKKLLFVGDAGCPSGFARASHEILNRLVGEYDITVLAINYRGDPPVDPKTNMYYPYPMYSAGAEGDALGVLRLLWMCNLVRPDVIVIQNDGWHIPYYFGQLRQRKSTGEYIYPEFAAVPVVGAIAVDGKNFNGKWIKDLSLAIFWTQFALDEARRGGYAGPATVIPLGVDLDTFYHVDKDGALMRQKAVGLTGRFVVGNVNRNQPRKRWDLTIKYYAEWVHSRSIKDATLFMHTAPTGEDSVNVLELAQYYDVHEQLAVCTPPVFYGKHDEDMRDTYSILDVLVSTTQGEGMGLTAMEAMACQVPCLLPDWSAFGSWARGAAALVPCTATALQVQSLSILGGVPDQKAFVEALDLLYRDKSHREMVSDLGYKRITESRFSWDIIGAQWLKALRGVLEPAPIEARKIWQEV